MRLLLINIALFISVASFAQFTKTVVYKAPITPTINWINPANDEISNSLEYTINVQITTNRAIREIVIIQNKNNFTIPVNKLKKQNDFFILEYTLKLQNGLNTITILAENISGQKVSSSKTIELSAFKATKVWAIMIGISKYERKNGLNYSDDDAHRLNTFLSSPEGGALAENQRVLLIDEKATKERILNDTKNLFSKANDDDLIIFYFSGHGDKNYFIPYDFNNQTYTFLYHSEIMDIINTCKANKKLFIADACFSGGSIGKKKGDNPIAVINEYYEGISTSNGFAFLTSSKGEEESQEINYFQQGVFSYFLIEGLRGKADTRAKEHLNKITIGELFNYICKNVVEETNSTQTPQMKCSNPDMIISIVRK